MGSSWPSCRLHLYVFSLVFFGLVAYAKSSIEHLSAPEIEDALQVSSSITGLG